MSERSAARPGALLSGDRTPHKNSSPGFGQRSLFNRGQIDDKSRVDQRYLLEAGGVTLLGRDEYVAIARDASVALFRFDDLLVGDDRREHAPRPVVEFSVSARVVLLRARGPRRPFELVAVLADNSIWAFDLSLPATSRHFESKARLLAERLPGRVTHLVSTRGKVFAVSGTGTRQILLEIDPAGGGTRGAMLPFARLASLTPLDAARGDWMVAVDEAHEAHLVGFPTDTDSQTLQVMPIEEISRVRAVTVLADRWMVVARKGGDLLKASYGRAPGGQAEAVARACRGLRALLKACGCRLACGQTKVPERPRPGDCDCKPEPGGGGGYGGIGEPGGGTGQPGGGRPGWGGRPDGTIPDDEPCDEKHTIALGWSVRALHPIGRYVAVVSQRGDRMAILDHNLNLMFERYLGRDAVLVAGTATTDRLLLFRPGRGAVEAWSIGDYTRNIRGIEPVGPRRRLPGRAAETASVTFYGRKYRPAMPNPHLNVAVFTVTEQGQLFSDPDQTKMQALLEENVYDVVTDYYDENSYGALDTQFSVFGVHIGTPRKPLVLPRAFASYFRDAFSPGGVEAVMPGDWTNPVTFDGTESMTLETDPSTGTGRDYDVQFAALWTSSTHTAYPVVVNFAGSETLQVNVTDQLGAAHALTLNFAALSLSHAQGDDQNAFLAALGTHVTNAVRAAEAALLGSPVTLADVVFRRIRTNDNDAEFGRLQAQFAVAAPPDPNDAAQKGLVSITPPGAPSTPLTALGIAGTVGQDGVLASATQIESYLKECLEATQFDANEGLGLNDPHISSTVTTAEDTTEQTVAVQIKLTSAKGGAGASIALTAHRGLDSTGWNTATSVPGSESNVNNQNTLRDKVELANDVFTAAMDHIRATSVWDPEAVRAQFADYDAMMIGFVGGCPTSVPVADRWNCADAVDFTRLRMFVTRHQATDLNNPDSSQPPVTMSTNLVIGQRFDKFDPGVMSHEVGHALGLPDLYSASGFRDDVLYIDDWCQMGGGNSRFNHFCAWSKWAVGWIVEDPGDADLNRVIDVPMPAPSGTTTTEAWLAPVEFWDSSMRADIEAAVGGDLPIGQMMKVHLGSDGGVVDLVEFRVPGVSYSQNLPPTPSVIVTNVLQPGTDTRWAVNGLYRRQVHKLNNGDELRNPGDTWNFAAGKEFPLKGCTIQVVDIQPIRGGAIPICRLRIDREAAEFIDLFFQDNVPSWRSPDIWIDWPGDNADPSEPRVYPEGTPTDQGEVVRFPSSSVEPHFLAVRPHNAGNVRAEDVKVRWFICDPPGAGDSGRWIERDTMTLPEIAGDTWEVAPFTWNVTPSTSSHQCLRAEIIDWTIPTEVDPATGDTLALSSDDVLLQNNNAQKNVFDFEALSGSPYEPIEFQFQVHNDAVVTETAYLCPDKLLWGATLEITPARANIPPNQAVIFNGKLTLNDQIIRPGCTNDQGFQLTAWRVAADADEQWGSCFYFVRPRLKTEIQIVQGLWYQGNLSVHGLLRVVSEQPVSIAAHLPLYVRVRIELQTGSAPGQARWVTAAVAANGAIAVNIKDLPGEVGVNAKVQAWFDRTDLLGSCRSKLHEFPYEAEPVIK